MTINRRSFLLGAAGIATGAALGPVIRVRAARGAPSFKAKRVVIVSIGGGLRMRESLGMAEGATMRNLFGDIPIIPGFGDTPAGLIKVAPEYQAREIVLPAPRPTPLYTEGALITNLRYAEGAPGHLQGAACLVSGMYNNIDNRADAHAPAPTLFEIHRRASNAPATDAWYVSVLKGFFRAAQTSAHPEYGPKFAGTWLSPQGVATPIIPLVTSGDRELALTEPITLPIINGSPEERAAVKRLSAILNANTPPYAAADAFFASADENDSFEEHLAKYFADPTFQAYYPASQIGIGLKKDDGTLDGTSDSVTTYHAIELLKKFKPTVLAISLFDVDVAHDDYNGYVRNQTVADACVSYLWDEIQKTEGLKDETAMLVVPEHGRHLFFNGKNPDSLGRSGLDHGQGDDGDRDVFLLALGPDFKPGVYSPTGVQQTGRTSGRYETIDMTMTAATLLGYGETMASELSALGARPGLTIGDILL